MNLLRLVPPALLLVSACVKIGFGPGGANAKYAYDGAECREVRDADAEDESDTKHMNRKEAKDTSLRELALVAVCPELEYRKRVGSGSSAGYINTKHAHTTARPDPKRLHTEFDDRYPDSVRAALFVIAVAARDDMVEQHDTGGRVGFEPVQAKASSPDELTEADMAAGLAAVYAGWARPEDLAKDLATLGLPQGAVAPFLALYKDAKAEIDRRVSGLSAAKRALVIDKPTEVVRARNEYYKKYAVQYRALDQAARAAEKGRGAAGGLSLAAALEKARTDYVTACGGSEECTYEPFYAEATKELALFYLAARMPAQTLAESRLLQREGMELTGFARAVHAVQHEAAMRAQEAFETTQRAQARGVDAKVTNAVNQGVAPLKSRHSSFWEPESRFPDYADLLKTERVVSAIGIVQAIKKKGADKATVEFKTTYDLVEEAVSCAKTNRIESISSDGRLNYEEICQYATKRVAREPPAPVVVDARDVAKVSPGETLHVLVSPGDERAAAVVDSHKVGDKESVVLQIRGDRVTPAKTARPRRRR